MTTNTKELISYLLSPKAIRDRCNALFQLGLSGKLLHWSLNIEKLASCAEFVLSVIREDYPTLQIPYHSRFRHFDVGGVNRLAWLKEQQPELGSDKLENARTLYDLVVTSVLLDAGAGPDWSFKEAKTNQKFSRSEGLAVASFHAFLAGAFSSDSSRPLRADADGLCHFTAANLDKYFQVSASNPIVGGSGRAGLLQALGAALKESPELFGSKSPRFGNLVDVLVAESRFGQEPGSLPAKSILSAVLKGLGRIWPGRVSLQGINLGDVWRHPLLQEKSGRSGSEVLGADLVPFHKLSQWLTYSLIEPLEDLGLRVVGVDELTGLPEYRNGGLFIDFGVIEAISKQIFSQELTPDHPAIVEWRALTVVLLDEIAVQIRNQLKVSSAELPLAKILQGGTWTAGRRIAAKLRPGGAPPLNIKSDGTVF